MKKSLPKNSSFVNNQEGYVAFAVTFIVMIIISLVVLGFAANSRQEQANALNNQLSTAAYYAAESGVNDAYAVIEGDNAAGTNVAPNLQTCAPSNYGNLNLDNTDNVKVSCLLVNPDPPSLEFSPLVRGDSEAVPLDGNTLSQEGIETSESINSVTISWQNHSSSSSSPAPTFGSCPSASGDNRKGNFVATGSYNCGAGVLQIDVFPDTLAAFSGIPTGTSGEETVFLQPVGSGGSSSYNLSSYNAEVLPVGCGNSVNAEYDCTVKLSLSSAPSYYMRITPYYLDQDVSVSANDGSLDLANAQALIDSTGEAGGVLKRIQERVCISDICSDNAPINGLQSSSGICKDFITRPAYTYSSSTLCQ
jgi:hypothetical protein